MYFSRVNSVVPRVFLGIPVNIATVYLSEHHIIVVDCNIKFQSMSLLMLFTLTDNTQFYGL